LQQIYSGFSELDRKGLVNIVIDYQEEKDRVFVTKPLLRVDINEKVKVIYDTLDGYNFIDNESIDGNLRYLSKVLEGVDFYFKRSFSPNINSRLQLKDRMCPLGLNYLVSSKYNFGNNIKSQSFSENVKRIIKNNRFLSRLLNVTSTDSLYYNRFESLPILNESPKIIFVANVWSPFGSKVMSTDPKEERITLNNMRADCVRLCKKNFGSNFFGGLIINDYSKKVFPDCLLHDNREALKTRFMNRVKQSDICIATTGLHGSIGWKFTEYVAASRSIVSERLIYELPGEFSVQKNYLEFSNADECVEKIDILINNKKLRYEMMLANYRYYNLYVKPESIILNSLIRILTSENS
jgi:hypothetical protein